MITKREKTCIFSLIIFSILAIQALTINTKIKHLERSYKIKDSTTEITETNTTKNEKDTKESYETASQKSFSDCQVWTRWKHTKDENKQYYWARSFKIKNVEKCENSCTNQNDNASSQCSMEYYSTDNLTFYNDFISKKLKCFCQYTTSDVVPSSDINPTPPQGYVDPEDENEEDESDEDYVEPTPEVICPDIQQWNEETQLCECPSGFQFAVSTQRCTVCGLGFDAATKKCICGDQTDLNNKYRNGDINEDGIQTCIFADCPIGQQFNESTLTCIDICFDNQFYNPDTQLCENLPTPTPINTCPEGQFFNPDTQICENSSTPTPINTCPQGQSYNSDTQICEDNVTPPSNFECPEGQYFNADLKECMQVIQQEAQGVHFVFIVDESGSQHDKDNLIINALNALLNTRKQLGMSDIFSVISFGSYARMQLSSASLTEVQDFNFLTFWGGQTNAESAFQLFYDYSNSIFDGKTKVVFYMSDGVHSIPFEILKKIKAEIQFDKVYLTQTTPNVGTSVLKIMSTILNRNTDGFIENTGSNEDFISFYSSYPPAFW